MVFLIVGCIITYMCTNKGKNMIKITIRLINQILLIYILRPAMLTNFMQNWSEQCSKGLRKMVHKM